MTEFRKIVAATLAAALLAACSPAMPERPSVAMPIPPGKPLQAFSAEDAWCRHAAFAIVRNDPWIRWAISRSNEEQTAIVAKGIALGLIAGAVTGRAVIGTASALIYGSVAGSAEAAVKVRPLATHMQAVYDASYAHCMGRYGNGPWLLRSALDGRHFD